MAKNLRRKRNGPYIQHGSGITPAKRKVPELLSRPIMCSYCKATFQEHYYRIKHEAVFHIGAS